MNLTTFTEFQKDFSTALETTINKDFLIENELRELNNFINHSPIPKIKRSGLVHLKKAKQTQIFNLSISDMLRPLFGEAVHSYLALGEFEFSKSANDTEESLKIKKQTSKQAFEFSEYYKWLNELQAIPNKAHKKSSLTHKQKLLALHYLGLDTSKYDNSKVAKILSEVLELSEDNTRQFLSYVSGGKNNEVRTKKNLDKVNYLFENQGLTDISNTIKKDIEKL